jgi:hypothetical protein
MKLLINGKEAKEGMLVKTFKGEDYVLIDWRSPEENLGGKIGKVYCKTKKDYDANKFGCREMYPTVIGGEFVEV